MPAADDKERLRTAMLRTPMLSTLDKLVVIGASSVISGMTSAEAVEDIKSNHTPHTSLETLVTTIERNQNDDVIVRVLGGHPELQKQYTKMVDRAADECDSDLAERLAVSQSPYVNAFVAALIWLTELRAKEFEDGLRRQGGNAG